jgi:peptidase C39-like protein
LSRFAQRLIIAVVLVAAAMPVPSAPGQASPAELHLLDVPYLPQKEALCGGAAIAMIMRYWGATNVYAESFADLVDPAASGIHGSDLVAALRSRGYDAQSIRGTRDHVAVRLAARQPVVALIEDRPGRFHYVVIVGWAEGHVIVHDPARAPFRILAEKTFLTAWAASDRWTLIATPSDTARPPDVQAETPSSAVRLPRRSSGEPCGDLMNEGTRLAGRDDVTGARRLFDLAARRCPEAAGPWRELAGLHALAAEWPAAASDARRALSKDSSDALAARILATALFLDDDVDGALAAWNRVGEPIIDLINVTGLERTRYEVAARLIGLDPQTLLTRNDLAVARRRLAELPAAQTTRLAMRPGENGRAQIDASIIERPLVPSSPIALTAVGLRGVTDREAAMTIASPSGGGEAWTASWRWWERRPKLALAFDSVAPFGGLWGVSIFGERQTYAAGATMNEESRRRAEFHVSNWTARGFRWQGTAGIDRFADGDGTDSRRAVSLEGALEGRLAGDRAVIGMRAGTWMGQLTTSRAALQSEWRSSTQNEGSVWSARAQGAIVGPDAPLALWPGAGTGQGRDGLLRAHPLIDDGVVRDAVFGRYVLDGSVEGRRWMQFARKPIRLAPALFLDTGRAYHALDPRTERWQTDVGAGLRIAIPGSGVLRIDVAHGLADGRTAFSMGWGK